MAEDTVDIATRTSQYVQLRDMIKEKDKLHKEKMQPYREALETLGNLLLKHLIDNKTESARTNGGTFFRSEKITASLESPDEFMRFVIGGEYWDLIDRKANAQAVADFAKANNGQLPPGAKLNRLFTVNVRRSNGKPTEGENDN